MIGQYHECWSDQTAVVKIVNHTGGWHRTAGPQRATHCHRHYDPSTRNWRTHRSDAPAFARSLLPDMIGHATDVLYETTRHLDSSADSIHAAAGVQLRAHLQRRTYHNTEGRSQTAVRTIWSVTVHDRRGAATTAIANRPVDIPHLVVSMCEGLGPPPTRTASINSVATGTPILLTPPTAGVLLHELIGHALEERQLRPGDVIGPEALQVIATRQSDAAWDDEGISQQDTLVIDNGLVSSTVLDRHTAYIEHGKAGGHAQRAAHGGRPRVRLTHLKVTAADSPPQRIPARYIVCRAVRSGRYWNGAAVLEVSGALLVTDYTLTRPVAPFHLCVTHDDLRRGLSLPREHPGDADAVERGGICVKDGEALPSVVHAPALTLGRYRYWTAQ